jgi:hypothetical protein
MKSEENDPDTLQSKDESNADWVKLWRKTTKKKSPPQNDPTIGLIPPQERAKVNLKIKSKKLIRA